MPCYLDSIVSGVTRHTTIPAVTFAGDFEVKAVAAQLGAGSNGTFIFAGSGVVGQNGLDLYRNSSGNYQLFINNTSVIGTTTAVTNNIAAPDTVIVRRLSGVVDLIINGVSRGTFSTSATLSVERLFHRSGWANYGRMGLYEFTITSGGSYNTSWSPSNSPSGGSTWTSSGGQALTQAGSWPANDSEWVPYGNVSVSQDVVVPASKQQDTAAAATIGTNQVLTVPAAKQQDVAAAVTIGTNQVLTVTGSTQQDTATVVTVGTTQVLSVPATKQQDVAAAVSVAQVAPGSQPITVPAAKQQDVAGVVTVGTSQLITAAGTKQQDSASAINVGQSQIVSVAAIKQQDKAASITVGTIQTLAVQPVTQTDTAARVAVGTTQLVAVPSVQQIDRAAAITLTQQPPITQTIDVRTLRIELTTPRFGVARNTPVYTAQLTTPRYTVARA